MVVSAPLHTCFDVGIDVAAYPDWVENIFAVEVSSKDEQGRVATARFEARGLGRSTRYELSYDLSQAPRLILWSLVTGDLTDGIDGHYRFDDITERPGMPLTEVTYDLTVDLAVPLPGFVKRRAEDKIVQAALHRFKLRAEEVSGRT